MEHGRLQAEIDRISSAWYRLAVANLVKEPNIEDYKNIIYNSLNEQGLSKCKRTDCCINKIYCKSCSEYYGYIPKQSLYTDYIPVCPLGYGDCIYDPAYLKRNYPDYYKEEFGELTPFEASLTEHCQLCVKNDGIQYDDEDK